MAFDLGRFFGDKAGMENPHFHNDNSLESYPVLFTPEEIDEISRLLEQVSRRGAVRDLRWSILALASASVWVATDVQTDIHVMFSKSRGAGNGPYKYRAHPVDASGQTAESLNFRPVLRAFDAYVRAAAERVPSNLLPYEQDIPAGAFASPLIGPEFSVR